MGFVIEDALPHDLQTLGERLRAHGYASGFVTSNPNVGSFFGFGRGFDDIVELYGRREPGVVRVEELVARSAEVSSSALAWLDRATRPFFLVVLCVDPHSPYTPPQEFDRFASGAAAPAQVLRAPSTWSRRWRAWHRPLPKPRRP